MAEGTHDHFQEVTLLLGQFVDLPEQYISPTPNCVRESERSLYLEVLETALKDFQHTSSGPRRKLLRRQARRWIEGKDYQWPFSFVNVCEALGINPVYLRYGLLHLGNTRAKSVSSEGKVPSLHLVGKR